MIAAWRAACAAAEREGGEQLSLYRLGLLRAYHRRAHFEELLEEAAPLLDDPRVGAELHYRCGEVRWLRFEVALAKQHYDALAARQDEWAQLGLALGLRCKQVVWGPNTGQTYRTTNVARLRLLQPLLDEPWPLGEAASRAHMQLQGGDERRRALEIMLKRAPDDASLILALAGEQLDKARQAKDEAAAAALREAKALIGLSATLCAPRRQLNEELKRSEWLRLGGDLQGAVALLEVELKRRPEALLQRLRLGELYEQLGQPLRAMRTWERGDSAHPLLTPWICTRPFPLRRRLARAFRLAARPELKLVGPLAKTVAAWRAELPAAAHRAVASLLPQACRGMPWSRLAPQLDALVERVPGPEVLLLAAELALGRSKSDLVVERVRAARAAGADPFRCDLLLALIDPSARPNEQPKDHPARNLWVCLRQLTRPEPYDESREGLSSAAPAWARRLSLRLAAQRAGPDLPQRIEAALTQLGYADANVAFASATYNGLRDALSTGDWGPTLEFLASIQGLLPQPIMRATTLQVFLQAPESQRAPFRRTMDLWKAEVEERLEVGSQTKRDKVVRLLRLIRGLERMADPNPERDPAGVAADLMAGLELSPIREFIAARYTKVYNRQLR